LLKGKRVGVQSIILRSNWEECSRGIGEGVLLQQLIVNKQIQTAQNSLVYLYVHLCILVLKLSVISDRYLVVVKESSLT